MLWFSKQVECLRNVMVLATLLALGIFGVLWLENIGYNRPALRPPGCPECGSFGCKAGLMLASDL
jgi:hypothetical protein